MKILFVLLAYLIGSFPTGFVFFRLSEKKDIRQFGSQSMGATNVLRLKGWKYALSVMIVDIFKGFLPVFLAMRLFSDQTFALVCGFMAVLGHCFPVYIKFRGGKGVATTVGMFAAVALKPLLFMLVIFVAVAALTRYVSLGSLLASMSFPAFAFLFKEEKEILWLGLAIFLLIAFKHRSNIRRLLAGNEKKLGEKIV